MRYTVLIVVFAIGIASGWFGHEFLAKRDPPRVTSQKTAVEIPPAAADPAPLPRAPSPQVQEEKVPAEEEGPVPVEATDPEDDRLREMILSQSKMWKGFAGMQMKQRADALLAGLPFDAAR